MPIVTCRNAAFAYDGEIAARGLDFEINRGDYLCIVGENGSGKSTLVKGLLSLIAPCGGSIEIKSRRVGYLQQQTNAQRDFPANVFEIALSGRIGRLAFPPFYSRADKAAALAALAKLGIADLRARCFCELSGGQRQRVLLARALCSAPELLVLDEPAAGLDPVAESELCHLISALNRNNGLTIIMVTHDIHNAVKHASHILHMRTAQAFFGTAADYVRSDIGADFVGCRETVCAECSTDGRGHKGARNV